MATYDMLDENGDIVSFDDSWGPAYNPSPDSDYSTWANYGSTDTGSWGDLGTGSGGTGSGSGAGSNVFPVGDTGSGLSGLFSGLSVSDLTKLGVLGTTAVGSVLDGQTPASTTTVNTDLPDWYTQAAQSTILKGMAAPEYTTFMDQPGALQRTTDLSSYISPYVQATLDPTLTQLGQDYSRAGDTLDANASKTGAFGGSRNILEQSLLNDSYLKAKTGATANAYGTAYTNAQSAYGKDQSIQYDDWINQYKSPLQTAGVMATTLGAVKPEGVKTTTSSTDTGSTWDQLYGLGTQLYGLGADSKAPAVTPAVTV